MNDLYYMKQISIKNLTILCAALLQLSACSGGEDGGGNGNGGGGGQSAVGANSGSTTVRWVAPMARADGGALLLSDIDGYRVYYGLQTRQYTNQVDVNNGAAQQVTVTDKRGFYYFVVTTIDTDGRESQFSPEFLRTL